MLASASVGPFLHIAPPLRTPEMQLGDALDRVLAYRCRGLPVLTGHWSPLPRGEIGRHDLLLALQDRIAERLVER